jgi:hypothetical protein
MPRAGFETATLATKLPQTALDRAATGIGVSSCQISNKIQYHLWAIHFQTWARANYYDSCEILGPQGSEYEDESLLG